MSNWHWIVISLCALLLFFTVWKEYERSNRSNLLWRLLAAVFGIVSLALMAIPISRTQTIEQSQQQVMHIVTTGYSEASPASESFTNTISLAKPGISYLPDIASYLHLHNEYSSLHIHGYGLPAYELERLKTYPITYTAPTIPAGFIVANWQQYLSTGGQLLIAGQYNNTTDKPVKLLLYGLSTPLDSVMLSNKGVQHFSLQTTPKHIGTAVYQLLALQEKDTIATEPIPIVVRQATPVNILMLASAPNFENRFLADWLYNNHFNVVVKSNISKNKTAIQLFNANIKTVDALSHTLLSGFNVLVADDESLNQLTASEKNAVQQAVENGLGIIMNMDSSLNHSFAAKAFGIYQQAGHNHTQHQLLLQGSAGRSIPLQAEEWSYIQPSDNAIPLVTDEQQKILAACSMYGAGKLVANTIYNSYSLMLAGNKTDYAKYWSLLLSNAAKPTDDNAAWQWQPKLPVKDQPLTITLQKNSTTVPVIGTADGDVYLQQHAQLPFQWTGTYWPKNSYWQTIYSGSDSCTVFIYDTTQWKSARAFQLMQEQPSFIQMQHGLNASGNSSNKKQVTKELPRIYFFILLLICGGYLWWEEKKTGMS